MRASTRERKDTIRIRTRTQDQYHGEEDRKEERAELLAKDIADDEHNPSMYVCMYL
jgi:hypothetical protein